MMTMAITRQRTPVLPLVARHAERLDQNKQKKWRNNYILYKKTIIGYRRDNATIAIMHFYVIR